MAVNLNDLAKEITLKEGKAKNMSIAQVKEVMKITLEELAEMDMLELAKVLKKYQKKA